MLRFIPSHPEGFSFFCFRKMVAVHSNVWSIKTMAVIFFSHHITMKLIWEPLKDEDIIFRRQIWFKRRDRLLCIYLANVTESLLHIRHFSKPAEGDKDVYRHMGHSTSKTLVASFTMLWISILHHLQFVTHFMLFICIND